MTDPQSPLVSALSDRYRIERELGAGGMATVYLAQDVRHHRKVALKVLKPELAAVVGSERFLAEIRTTANLQHPHILPLFDSGEADGFLFFVMPYVEGESLRDRLDREKQLPVEEAVRIATEVADALAHAHAKGVIHRDIKPANILLRDGRVQVADFGIALAVQQAGGARLTETGLSVGTPHYMSPEQASGDRQLDGRSDVYSLGCVLYELLAGEPPHVGPTAQAILAKILTEEPRPLSQLRRSVPPHVEVAVQTALKKLPADRIGSAEGFGASLAGRSFSGVHGVSAGIPARADPWRRIALVALLLAAGSSAATLWAWLKSPLPPSAPQAHVNIDLPEEAPLSLTTDIDYPTMPALAISPDGSRLVYVAATASGTALYQRHLESFDAVPIPGTEGAAQPFFSPDGNAIGYFARGQLWKVALADGTSTALAEVRFPRGASWGTDGRILVSEDLGASMVWVDATGGRKVRLTTECSDFYCKSPQILPDGKSALVWGYREVTVVSLETGKRTPILQGVMLPNPRFVPPGFIVVSAEPGRLVAYRFDPASLELRQPGALVLDGLRREWTGMGQYAVSETGTIAFMSGNSTAIGRLTWVTRQGVEEAVPYPEEAEVYASVRLSPDGRRLAAAVRRTDQNIRVYDLDGRSVMPLTRDGWNELPVWSPDARRLAFSRLEGPDQQFDVQVAEASTGNAELLMENALPYEWTRDGTIYVATLESHGGVREWDILAIPSDGGPPIPESVGPGHQDTPRISPDGEVVAFITSTSGDLQVYVKTRGTKALAVRISTDGGKDALWSHDGRELFYRYENGFYAVRVHRDPLRADPPRLLFDRPYVYLNPGSWDVAPDGRFLLVKSTDERVSAPSVRVVFEWTRQLDRLIRTEERR